MLFNSLEFLLFLGVLLLLYGRLGQKGQNRLLLFASYFFYGWWDWRFLGLLWLSSITDYCCGLYMARTASTRQRRWGLMISLMVNLGVLAFFKYFNFFRDSLADLFTSLGMQADWPTLYIILPVGISFYTFQTLSYSIDVYRGELKPCRSFPDFALYVAFFPQLVAGPIERATRLLPQIQSTRSPSKAQVMDGIGLILTGFLKKVVIADQLAGLVQVGFASSNLPFEGMSSWGVVLAFTFQIYGDFSGYSDIARGVAKLLGFELMLNFAKPYLVPNISQFWRHWHISLSTWLRDYLYIPLGGSRRGHGRTLVNLMIVMFLGGLWHGAGWGYVVWGLYIGGLLVVHQLFGMVCSQWGLKERLENSRAAHGLACLITFVAVCFGWLIFRAAAVPDAELQIHLVKQYVQAMTSFEWTGQMLPYIRGLVLLCGASMLFQRYYTSFEQMSAWPARRQACFICGALLMILILGKADGTDFIYFQF